jgi:hypothetical protein
MPIIDLESPLVDLFTNNAFKEELVATSTSSVPAVKPFSCTTFGETPTVVKILNTMRSGAFLDSFDARESDSQKILLTIPNLAKDQMLCTKATLTDLHRLGNFYIIDHKGDHISISRESIIQSTPKEPAENNPSQEEDNIKFFEAIAYLIYTKENKAYAHKFFNILGKYFHQGGIGVFINSYLCELANNKGIVMNNSSKVNNVTFDLTQLNQGIIKITEHLQFNAALKRDNPEEIIKREDGQPIATFNFPFIARVNAHNDECIIDPLPLTMDIIDLQLMSETYFPNLKNTTNLMPINPLGQIHATLTGVIDGVSSALNGVLPYNFLLFGSNGKKDHADLLLTKQTASMSNQDSSTSDFSGKEASNSIGSSPDFQKKPKV